MSGPAPVGWCPGALRPMASGDGLILRVKPRGGRLTLDQAGAVAHLSQAFGNGHLDLTGRANLQIRGADPETLEALWSGLRTAGLLDQDAGTEALRNIVASPLAGIDHACVDIRPFVQALEVALAGLPQACRGFQSGPRLPAKWSFVVDGGGCLPLTDVPADVRFRFAHDGSMQVGLAGCWAEPRADGLDLLTFLASVIALSGCDPALARMEAILARGGLDAVFEALDLREAAMPAESSSLHGSADALSIEVEGGVGFVPAFGSLHANGLAAIADLGRAFNAGDLRLTPWRTMVMTDVVDRAALRTALRNLDLIVDADDPRLAVTACVGAPACHRATVPARADALALAQRLTRDLDTTIHVAGCSKECARPASARWTLTGSGNRYDLAAKGESAPRATGLSSTEALNWIHRAERTRTS